MTHPLDRPVWNALTSGWAPRAEGDARALRLQPDHGPFGAAADASASSVEALAALAPEQGELWLVEADEPVVPQGLSVIRTGLLTQMVAERIARAPAPVDFVELGDADAEEMRALAELTRPGPFLSRTHRLGWFIGMRREGQLVAMAGERMRVGAFAEVSAVCTHPDHRGRGYAAALMAAVMQRMLDGGETPFLHSYAANASAIALYESLGFQARRTMRLTVTARSDQGSSKLASP